MGGRHQGRLLTPSLSAADVVAMRVAAQQLDRPLADRPVTDAAILDLGVQDSGRDGASWALANRGVPVPGPAALTSTSELALVWSLRGSPHLYRRADLPDVLAAVSPFSEADAARRIIGADVPLSAAGISAREGLVEVAGRLRRLTAEPTVKGDLSGRLSAELAPAYLRDCVPCQTVHIWELTFRLGAFYAGLELKPATSPPVLRRISGWPERDPGPAPDPMAAPERLQVIRSYLRFLGPATPRDGAAFLDASPADVSAHWPEDAVEVRVERKRAWSLSDPVAPSVDPHLVRLLGPFDLLVSGKDHDVLVPDPARRKALWPALGRPGSVLVGTDIVGAWRPKAAGKKFSVRLDLWSAQAPGSRDRIEEQAAALAAHRGLTFAGLIDE